MQTEGIGVGILGTGMSAGMHARALQSVPDVRVEAVAATSLAKAQAFAAEWGIPRAGVGLESLLREPAVQLVHLCTPPYLHVEEARACAAAGRHVLIEKPMARNVAEADAIIQACAEAGVTLACLFQYRFMPLAQRARAALLEGELGRVISADVFVKWWRSPEYYRSGSWRATRAKEGGGVLINQAIHLIDLAQWLVGPVEELQGLAHTGFHDIETEDIGLALLRYASGAVGVLDATTVAYPGFAERIEIHGELGTLILNQGQGTLEWHLKGEAGPRIEGATEQRQAAAGDPRQISYAGHIAEFTQVIEALLARRRPPIDGAGGRAAVAIVEAIYRSSASRRPVRLADL
jgi:predicted dehydrogenase